MHSVQDKTDGNGKGWEILRLAESKLSSVFIILTTYVPIQAIFGDDGAA